MTSPARHHFPFTSATLSLSCPKTRPNEVQATSKTLAEVKGQDVSSKPPPNLICVLSYNELIDERSFFDSFAEDFWTLLAKGTKAISQIALQILWQRHWVTSPHVVCFQDLGARAAI